MMLQQAVEIYQGKAYIHMEVHMCKMAETVHFNEKEE